MSKTDETVFIVNHFPLTVEICKKSGHIVLTQNLDFQETQEILINKDDLKTVINDLQFTEGNYQSLLDEKD